MWNVFSYNNKIELVGTKFPHEFFKVQGLCGTDAGMES